MSLKDLIPGQLGFGAAPLGNMFRAIPEDEALATVDAAWNDGIRYFDNAPFYGAGLAELRMGEAHADGQPNAGFGEIEAERTGFNGFAQIEGHEMLPQERSHPI